MAEGHRSLLRSIITLYAQRATPLSTPTPSCSQELHYLALDLCGVYILLYTSAMQEVFDVRSGILESKGRKAKFAENSSDPLEEKVAALDRDVWALRERRFLVRRWCFSFWQRCKSFKRKLVCTSSGRCASRLFSLLSPVLVHQKNGPKANGNPEIQQKVKRGVHAL